MQNPHHIDTLFISKRHLDTHQPYLQWVYLPPYIARLVLIADWSKFNNYKLTRVYAVYASGSNKRLHDIAGWIKDPWPWPVEDQGNSPLDPLIIIAAGLISKWGQACPNRWCFQLFSFYQQVVSLGLKL